MRSIVQVVILHSIWAFLKIFPSAILQISVHPGDSSVHRAHLEEVSSARIYFFVRTSLCTPQINSLRLIVRLLCLVVVYAILSKFLAKSLTYIKFITWWTVDIVDDIIPIVTKISIFKPKSMTIFFFVEKWQKYLGPYSTFLWTGRIFWPFFTSMPTI